jgi:hypothetical protein
MPESLLPVNLNGMIFHLTADQADDVAELLAFLAASPTHRLHGFVSNWKLLPDPNVRTT